jgi:hypothetical protein
MLGLALKGIDAMDEPEVPAKPVDGFPQRIDR